MKTRARDILTPGTVPAVTYFACDDQRRAQRPRDWLETDGKEILVTQVVGEVIQLTIHGSTVKAKHARTGGHETRNRRGAANGFWACLSFVELLR